jgi:hypothetical protein
MSSKKQNAAKNPFKCFDCKTFCTSTYKQLQAHRIHSCAYVKSKKEQLHKKLNLGNVKQKRIIPDGGGNFEFPNQEILISPIIEDSSSSTNNQSFSIAALVPVLDNSNMEENQHRYDDNMGDDTNYHEEFDSGIGNGIVLSPNPEPQSFTSEMNYQQLNYFKKYSKWQEKVQQLLYNKNLNNNQSFQGLTTYIKTGWTYDINMNQTRGKPKISDLLELFAFTKLNYLSTKGGNGLLALITNFVSRHPTKENIYLYKSMSSINTAVTRAVNTAEFFLSS